MADKRLADQASDLAPGHTVSTAPLLGPANLLAGGASARRHSHLDNSASFDTSIGETLRTGDLLVLIESGATPSARYMVRPITDNGRKV